jgi:hypothetical protein
VRKERDDKKRERREKREKMGGERRGEASTRGSCPKC